MIQEHLFLYYLPKSGSRSYPRRLFFVAEPHHYSGTIFIKSLRLFPCHPELGSGSGRFIDIAVKYSYML